MFKERIKTHHSAMADGKKYVRGMKNLVEALSEETKEGDASVTQNKNTIYIHVPFCAKICTFCNMQRSLSAPVSDYGTLLRDEIYAYAKLPKIKEKVFDAIYFGGGTPTTLSADVLRDVIVALKSSFCLTEDAEITIETTVTQLTEEKLMMFQEVGVNRFSIGVQTFSDRGREIMGRIGSGQKAYEKLRQVKEMGFAIVSMDLIYNYPGQTMEELKQDLDHIIALDLDGFSMYSLIDMKENRIDKAQNSENDMEMFQFISDYMEKAGYRFLELTKMVKRDSYRYVLNRHLGADTLPLGAGAGGSICGIACMNPIQIPEYRKSIEEFSHRKGMYFAPEYKELVRFKGDIQSCRLPRDTFLYANQEAYKDMLSKLLEHGYVIKDQRKEEYALTTKGIFWGNTISRELSGMLVTA